MLASTRRALFPSGRVVFLAAGKPNAETGISMPFGVIGPKKYTSKQWNAIPRGERTGKDYTFHVRRGTFKGDMVMIDDIVEFEVEEQGNKREIATNVKGGTTGMRVNDFLQTAGLCFRSAAESRRVAKEIEERISAKKEARRIKRKEYKKSQQEQEEEGQRQQQSSQ